MILKASQRGGGMQLGAHLLKAENEHVEVHEIRGFLSDTVLGAMKEAQAVAQGTRCKQFLFSVSLNPPDTEAVSVDDFEAAIARIEETNGLTGQPRLIVFHEKQGRRHAHAVWSRIDTDTMTARPLPFFKTKLRDLAKSLYLEHGWKMPGGLMDSKERDPRNFTLAEWQQAKRMGRDPGALKALIQECWAVSDSRASFAKALEERGLYLARGDSRAHVAVTYEGEVLSVARMAGKRTKAVMAKLGKADDLRGVADTRAHIAGVIAPRLKGLIREADASLTESLRPLEARRHGMTALHRRERERLAEGQSLRRQAESRHRAERFRSGMGGLWDRLTGKHSAVRRENEREAFQSYARDRTQRDGLVADQLRERRNLQRDILAVRRRHAAQLLDLHRDLVRQVPDREAAPGSLRRDFAHDASPSRADSPRSVSRGGGRGQSRGPDLGR